MNPFSHTMPPGPGDVTPFDPAQMGQGLGQIGIGGMAGAMSAGAGPVGTAIGGGLALGNLGMGINNFVDGMGGEHGPSEPWNNEYSMNNAPHSATMPYQQPAPTQDAALWNLPGMMQQTTAMAGHNMNSAAANPAYEREYSMPPATHREGGMYMPQGYEPGGNAVLDQFFAGNGTNQ